MLFECLKAILKLVFNLFRAILLVLGLALFIPLSWAASEIFYSYVRDARTVTYPLENGFIFTYDMESGGFLSQQILTKDHKHAVYSDVLKFAEYRDAVYGLRRDLEGNLCYFICYVGKDCEDSQHLSKKELKKILKENGFPAYWITNFKTLRSTLREKDAYEARKALLPYESESIDPSNLPSHFPNAPESRSEVVLGSALPRDSARDCEKPG